MPEVARLSGWGHTTATTATVHTTDGEAGVAAVLRQCNGHGVVARGLGRSYGDAAQNAGGAVIAPISPYGPLELDTAGRRLRAPAGASLERLLRFLLPRGWRLPVLPGTRFVTVGGAIAADVHGKNHHDDGSFGRWVHELTLVGSDGAKVLSPATDADGFWATVAGMGLTGVITSATLAVEPAATTAMRVRTTKLDDLAAAMDAMEASTARYHVAWVDAAPHRGFGRAVLDEGEHAEEQETDLTFTPRAPLPAPPLPVNVVRPPLIAAFNRVWWQRARHDHESLVPMTRFFHPLDGVGDWHRLYGGSGLVQWQIAVPFGERDLVHRALWRLSQAGAVPSLVVLKRFGAATPAPLSFPFPGWTLAVDVAAGHPSLPSLLRDLDEEVADAGGRVYLAKDSRAAPATLARMYPRLEEWRAVRARLDPAALFTSDLGRRLALT